MVCTIETGSDPASKSVIAGVLARSYTSLCRMFPDQYPNDFDVFVLIQIIIYIANGEARAYMVLL